MRGEVEMHPLLDGVSGLLLAAVPTENGDVGSGCLWNNIGMVFLKDPSELFLFCLQQRHKE